MKIAFVLNEFPVLYNTYHLNLIRDLIEQGVDVQIFAVARAQQSAEHEGIEALLQRTHYLRDFVEKERSALARVLNRGLAKLERLSSGGARMLANGVFGPGVSPHRAERYQDLLGWAAWGLPQAAAFLKAERFDFIHGGFAARPATVARVLSELSGIAFTFEAHAEDVFVAMRAERRDYEQDKVARAAGIFTISEYNTRYFDQQLHYPLEKLAVFRVPFNRRFCDTLQPREPVTPRLTSLCRLHPIKGLEDGIEAFATLVDRHPQLVWDIIGDGPLRESLQAKIDALGLQDKIRLWGARDNETSLSEIAQSTAFFLPCVIPADGNRDGIPTALIEAMYLGVPVVSTDVSGIPELVIDQQTGLLAKSTDVADLARQLDRVITDQSLRQRLAEQGRAWVTGGFYAKPTPQVFIDHWRSLLANT